MSEKTKRAEFDTLPKGEDKCIWMEAGVIDYKLCNNYYNCHTCTFDKAMKESADKNAAARALGIEPTGKKGSIVSWQQKMRERQGLNRICRHSLTGRAPSRLCPYHFECQSCQFEQMLEDSLEIQIPYRLTSIPEVDGYRVPDGHFFHIGHTWARIENGGRIRIGFDDFSMRLFGPVDKIDLPLTGEQLKFNEIGAEFTRTDKQAGVLSPISGVVAAVNYQAVKDPDLVKTEPYNEGWLMVLDPTDMKRDIKDLMYGKQSTDWIRSEHQVLIEMISQVGLTYADGGYIEDIVGNVPTLGWEKLAHTFLRT